MVPQSAHRLSTAEPAVRLPTILGAECQSWRDETSWREYYQVPTTNSPARERPVLLYPRVLPQPRSLLPPMFRVTAPEMAPEPARKETQAPATDLMDMSSESGSSTPGSSNHVLPEEVEIFETTLRRVYGITIEEANIPVRHWQPLLLKYVEGLHAYAQQALEGVNQPEEPGDSRSTSTNQPHDSASGQSTSGTEPTRGVGKRCRDLAGNGEDGASGEGDGGNTRVGVAKKPKGSHTPRLKLSCPYRKRDPGRFGVRQRYSCSMTYFDTFAKLR